MGERLRQEPKDPRLGPRVLRGRLEEDQSLQELDHGSATTIEVLEDSL